MGDQLHTATFYKSDHIRLCKPDFYIHNPNAGMVLGSVSTCNGICGFNTKSSMDKESMGGKDNQKQLLNIKKSCRFIQP